MTRVRRIAVIAAAVVVALLAALALLPLLFGNSIEQRVQAAVNRNVNARVAWRSAGLSFFRSFPNLALTLDDLTIAGTGRFQGDTLASVRRVRVVVGLGSVIANLTGGKPLVVRAIQVERPRLDLVVLDDGTANWDIAKTSPPAAGAPSARPIAVSLRRFEITDGAISLDDRHAKLRATLAGFDQTLQGDVRGQQVAIGTKARADTATVVFAGIPYLDRVALALDATIQADLAAKSFALQHTELRVNDLALGVSGTVRSVDSLLALDLAFDAPKASFRSILSLVPAVYAHDFARVQTSGAVQVDGRVKGEYGKTAFPSFTVNAKVSNASFRYPDLPLPARDIAVDLSLANPGGSVDSTVIRLDRFHVVVGRNPIDAHMVVRTPVSDPSVDAGVSGTLDLADLRRTIKMTGIDSLAGTIAANVSVRARRSQLEAKQYDRVAASGTFDVSGVTVKGAALPHPLVIQRASLALAPRSARLVSFAGSVGSSDIQATGSLDNLLDFAFRQDTLRGSATVKSNRFDLNEWRSNSKLQIIPVPPRIDFSLDATANELRYGTMTMTDAHGKLRIANQRVTLQDFTMKTMGGQFAVTGYYETTHPDKPTFDVALQMTNVDIASAYRSLATVQALAPVAQYATGTVTTALQLEGALGQNMMPLFPGLTGNGTLQTTHLALSGFPPLQKIVDVTKLQFLNNPTLAPVKAAFRIENGRLTVQPFSATVGGVAMKISGSNGLDRSLQYALDLTVPRALLGSGANQALAGLQSKAAGAGFDIATAPQIPLGIQIGGTVTSPTVKVDVGSLASSVAKGAEQAVKTKVDTAAARLVQEAEVKATALKRSADSLAARVKAEGYRQADSLTARAGTNPLAQMAAKAAADKLRQQADDKAARIVREANQRADSLVAAARARAGTTGPE